MDHAGFRRGYASSGKAEGKELMAFDMDKALCERTAADIQGLVICESGRALCETADTVILGVKPQVIESVLRGEIRQYKSRAGLFTGVHFHTAVLRLPGRTGRRPRRNCCGGHFRGTHHQEDQRCHGKSQLRSPGKVGRSLAAFAPRPRKESEGYDFFR